VIEAGGGIGDRIGFGTTQTVVTVPRAHVVPVADELRRRSVRCYATRLSATIGRCFRPPR